MKLEVGMYARLKEDVYGTINILQIAEVYDETILTENNGSMFQGEYSKENIIKASHNIIDLIEVGDYVNGLKVIEVRQHLHNDIEIVLTNGSFYWSFSKNESDYNIKSIVTKEQFESMSYKVGD